MFLKTILSYSFLLLKSTEIKNFEGLGRSNNINSKMVSRLLVPAKDSLIYLEQVAKSVFAKSKSLTIAIDDTLISKKYSKEICGTDKFYDTKIGREIIGIKGLFCAVTDGKICIPLSFDFLYNNYKSPDVLSKNEIVQQMIKHALSIFPIKIVTITADGAFANKALLNWCLKKNIRIEMRMHSNRRIQHNNNTYIIREMPKLKPKGPQTARTVKVLWHGMFLYLTCHKRIDKHGDITFVYQISTFKAKPSKHVSEYKKRWAIEKVFRTTKQSLGLKDCYSTKLETQKNHIAAVLVAYAITQIEQKTYRFNNAESAIKALRDPIYIVQTLPKYRSGAIFGGAMS